jgi:hypothetical protein
VQPAREHHSSVSGARMALTNLSSDWAVSDPHSEPPERRASLKAARWCLVADGQRLARVTWPHGIRFPVPGRLNLSTPRRNRIAAHSPPKTVVASRRDPVILAPRHTSCPPSGAPSLVAALITPSRQPPSITAADHQSDVTRNGESVNKKRLGARSDFDEWANQVVAALKTNRAAAPGVCRQRRLRDHAKTG